MEKDPQIKAHLQKAYELKKRKAAESIRELPLKDQRAKLIAQAKRLTTAVDKKQEQLASVHAELQDLRKDGGGTSGSRRDCFYDIWTCHSGTHEVRQGAPLGERLGCYRGSAKMCGRARRCERVNRSMKVRMSLWAKIPSSCQSCSQSSRGGGTASGTCFVFRDPSQKGAQTTDCEVPHGCSARLSPPQAGATSSVADVGLFPAYAETNADAEIPQCLLHSPKLDICTDPIHLAAPGSDDEILSKWMVKCDPSLILEALFGGPEQGKIHSWLG
eukprot:1669356-Amphidinium_carterae.5